MTSCAGNRTSRCCHQDSCCDFGAIVTTRVVLITMLLCYHDDKRSLHCSKASKADRLRGRLRKGGGGGGGGVQGRGKGGMPVVRSNRSMTPSCSWSR